MFTVMKPVSDLLLRDVYNSTNYKIYQDSGITMDCIVNLRDDSDLMLIMLRMSLFQLQFAVREYEYRN